MPAPSPTSRSSVWKRTVYYFLIIVCIFFGSAVFLLYSAGTPRTESEMLVAVSRTDIERRDHELFLLRKKIVAAGAQDSTVAVLDETIESNRERLKNLERILELEQEPKNQDNEREILETLERDYAALWDAWPHPEFSALLYGQSIRFALVLFVFFLGVSLVLYVLMKMILNPLESLIHGVRRVSEGDLDVSFQVGTRDELNELATVLERLVAHYRQLLYLMKSSSRNGIELTDQLNTILPAADHPDSPVAQEIAAKAEEFRVLFESIDDFTN